MSNIKCSKFTILLIANARLETIDLFKKKDLDLILVSLKNTYENYWKSINQINTSIKLPLTISINANKYKKISVFEYALNELDLVSNFEILRFLQCLLYL